MSETTLTIEQQLDLVYWYLVGLGISMPEDPTIFVNNSLVFLKSARSISVVQGKLEIQIKSEPGKSVPYARVNYGWGEPQSKSISNAICEMFTGTRMFGFSLRELRMLAYLKGVCVTSSDVYTSIVDQTRLMERNMLIGTFVLEFRFGGSNCQLQISERADIIVVEGWSQHSANIQKLLNQP